MTDIAGEKLITGGKTTSSAGHWNGLSGEVSGLEMLIDKSIPYWAGIGSKKMNLSKIILSLVHAVRFDLGEINDLMDVESILDIKNVKELKRLPINLPYPTCYFEFRSETVRYGIYLGQEPDTCFLYGGVFYPGRSPTGEFILMPDPFMVVTEGAKNGENYVELKFVDDSKPLSERQQLIMSNSAASLILTLQALKVMNCSNIIIKDHKPGKFINQKRKKKSKIPLLSYKTLHIDTGQKVVSRKAAKGTHASPRVHLRRGHIRRLASGKTVWVQPCVVGNKDQGAVIKDYSLEDPTTTHREVAF